GDAVGGGLRGSGKGGVSGSLSDQYCLGFFDPHRYRTDTEINQSRSLYERALSLYRQSGNDTREGKVAVTPADFEHRPCRILGRRRKARLGENFVRQQSGRKVTQKESVGRNSPHRVRPARHQFGVESDGQGRQLRRRISVGETAADGSAAANLRMRDEIACLPQDGQALSDQSFCLQGALARVRTNRNSCVRGSDIVQL